jgi:hypothetical protein
MSALEHGPRVVIASDQLALLDAELAGVLFDLRQIESELAAQCSALAAEPPLYRSLRESLDRLDAERRALLERLGELTQRVIVLRKRPCVVEEATCAIESTTADLFVESSESSESSDIGESSAPSSPATEEQLAQFIEGFRAPPPPASRPQPRPPDDRTILLALAARVTIAGSVSDTDVVTSEVEQLERAAAHEREAQWRQMTRDGQVRWLSLLVAWARALSVDARRLGVSEAPIDDAFRALRSFSMTDRPGFVLGFARLAEPRSGNWRTDAVQLLEEVRPKGEGSTPRSPRIPRRRVDDAPTETPSDDEEKLPADWPYLERVKNRELVMFGGEAREERRAVLERVFQLESLEWVPHDKPRLLASLSRRATQGSIHLILVNKFVAHRETIALEKASKTPIVSVRNGYGVTAVRLALEEYFSRQGE